MIGSRLFESLYCMIEVREMTLRPGILATSVINASVMPSANYCWAGSPERFCRGSTASDWMGAGPGARCFFQIGRIEIKTAASITGQWQGQRPDAGSDSRDLQVQGQCSPNGHRQPLEPLPRNDSHAWARFRCTANHPRHPAV